MFYIPTLHYTFIRLDKQSVYWMIGEPNWDWQNKKIKIIADHEIQRFKNVAKLV